MDKLSFKLPLNKEDFCTALGPKIADDQCRHWRFFAQATWIRRSWREGVPPTCFRIGPVKEIETIHKLSLVITSY